MKKKPFLTMALAGLALSLVGAPAHAAFVAYNDCVQAGEPNPYTTIYSGYLGGGGGFEIPSGLLMDITTGVWTSVTARLEAYNISYGTGTMPNAGTDAYNWFNGYVNMDASASSTLSDVQWWYKVTFTGLDPTKVYDFVTTANRNGSYAIDRFGDFIIQGADTYTNQSSPGVTVLSPDDIRLNSGENTIPGYVVRWSDITATDGSFTVLSQGFYNDKWRGYGMQAFRLEELDAVPEPITMVMLGCLGGGMVLARKLRRKKA